LVNLYVTLTLNLIGILSYDREFPALRPRSAALVREAPKFSARVSSPAG
jgi:hypothetical protein